MNIQHVPWQSPIIREKDGLEEFFDKVFTCLEDELQILRSTIYDYDQHDLIFGMTERTWVGVFTNAIVKAFPDRVSTLQEYTVYSDKEYKGRADLLVYWKNAKGQPIYFLFEAKQYEETAFSSLNVESKNLFEKTLLQARKYIEAESAYFEGKTVYLVPIFFGWIRKPDFLDKAKEFFDESDKSNLTSEFCHLFFEEDKGVWVFGNTIKYLK